MNADDFQSLYNLLRGSRTAMAVLDARALFTDKKFDASSKKLSDARESFAESRARVIRQVPEKQVDPKAKDRDRQIKKIKRKQEKAKETLDAFDELIAGLGKSAERQRSRLERAASRAAAMASIERDDSTVPAGSSAESELVNDADLASTGTSKSESSEQQSPRVARPSDLSSEFIEAFGGSEGDDRLDIISQRFGFREVHKDSDLHGWALYFIQTSSRSLLVGTPEEDEMREEVPLVNLIDGRPIKPVSREAFLRLGNDRKMVLLTYIDAGGSAVMPDSESITSEALSSRLSEQSANGSGEAGGASNDDFMSAEDPIVDSGELKVVAKDAAEQNLADDCKVKAEDANALPIQNVLDMGAFSQLLSAAQRSGLVSGADQIGHVRDREFRMGHYDQAFQAIDSLFSRFSANASQRIQRISREDSDIASGRVKMSPKDLQAKRARDRMQSQEVDRATRRFQVVLEGLRVLMNQA